MKPKRNRKFSIMEQTELADIPIMVEEVERLLKQIPKGCVSTYGDIARALGSKTVARWVGEYMVQHEHQRFCMCHRVVRSTGEIGLYWNRDSNQKAQRLKREGVTVEQGFVPLDQFRFDQFRCSAPLEELERRQSQVAEQVELRSRPATFQRVAGVDVSYQCPTRAVGAYVLVDSKSGQVVWSTTTELHIPFPYISGFLAYRELRVHRRLVQKAKSAGKLAKVIMVDGNGILHPRRCGIATHLGVEFDLCTIGVGKTQLCGKIEDSEISCGEESNICLDDEIVGKVLKSSDSNRRIFVSPGQNIDVESAAKLCRALWFEHNLPEPVYQADSISRKLVRQLRKASSPYRSHYYE